MQKTEERTPPETASKYVAAQEISGNRDLAHNFAGATVPASAIEKQFLEKLKDWFLQGNRAEAPLPAPALSSESFFPSGVNAAAVLQLNSPAFLDSWAEKHGLARERPLPIAVPRSSTLFTTAGVQTFEPFIHGANFPGLSRALIAQPVARFHGLGKAQNGFHSGFINLCIEQVQATPEQHFQNFELFLDLLQTLGISRQDLTFEKIGPVEQEWGGIKLRGLTVSTRFKGLELGDACYLYNIRHSRLGGVTISDVGFGMERLLYLVGGGNSYFHMPGMRQEWEKLDLDLLDGCRTLALLLGSGVYPGPRAQGQRIRLIMKNIVDAHETNEVSLKEMFSSFYRAWKQWTFLTFSEKAAWDLFNREHHRAVHAAIVARVEERAKNKKFGGKIEQSSPSFLASLKASGFSVQQIQEAVSGREGVWGQFLGVRSHVSS